MNSTGDKDNNHENTLPPAEQTWIQSKKEAKFKIYAHYISQTGLFSMLNLIYLVMEVH